MFFKKIKNKSLFLLLLLIIPNFTFAYSDYIIASGKNIGIELKSSGIIIVGTYDVNGDNPAIKAGLQNGDKIIKINDTEVSDIEEMQNYISSLENKNDISITYLRGSKENTTILSLNKDNSNTYKTGLYVKDSITGVGTLTFIDPNTKLFGALGHEIIEKNTRQKLEITSGTIYDSTVTSVTKSNIGNPGEKNVRYNSAKTFGNIFENTTSGIFGNYSEVIPDNKLYKVSALDEIKIGKAKILTVIEGTTIEEFSINIIKVNKDSNVVKNILFEVTDERLLKTTGGIVQGMSGSPIIQDNNIIGAVTHVVINEPTKGYGISIIKMLEEAEN